ncbi:MULTISPECIES: NUDIX hydrolase [unclassified Rhizobium]|nr:MULTISPECIES: NUDIX hydrolase [unclassified Rhizobium]
MRGSIRSNDCGYPFFKTRRQAMAASDQTQPAPINLAPWEIKRSSYPLRDRWLTVRADDCVTSEGVEIAPYYVLEYSDWVQVVAIDTEDNILLLRQYRHALGRISLELPGGAIDAKDGSPVQAAQRELREETGFSAAEWLPVASLSPNPATHTNLCHIVLALGIECNALPDDNPTERTEIVRVPIREAIRMMLAGEMIQAIHVAALTLALNKAGKWIV